MVAPPARASVPARRGQGSRAKSPLLLCPLDETHEKVPHPGRVAGSSASPTARRPSVTARPASPRGSSPPRPGRAGRRARSRPGLRRPRHLLVELEGALVQVVGLRVRTSDRGGVGSANGCPKCRGEVARREQVVRQLGGRTGRRRAREILSLHAGSAPASRAGGRARPGGDRRRSPRPAGRAETRASGLPARPRGALDRSRPAGRRPGRSPFRPSRLDQRGVDRPADRRDDRRAPDGSAPRLIPTRARSRSFSVAGRGVAGPTSAASSSSTRNGLPAERPAIASMSVAGTVSPRIARTSRATSTRSRRPSSMRDSAPATRELGEDGEERMPPVELVGSVGRHDRRPALAEPPREVGEELESRLIGPVDVLQHEDEGLGRAIEETSHCLVHPAVAPAAVAGSRRRVARGRAATGRARGERGRGARRHGRPAPRRGDQGTPRTARTAGGPRRAPRTSRRPPWSRPPWRASRARGRVGSSRRPPRRRAGPPGARRARRPPPRVRGVPLRDRRSPDWSDGGPSGHCSPRACPGEGPGARPRRRCGGAGDHEDDRRSQA